MNTQSIHKATIPLGLIALFAALLAPQASAMLLEQSPFERKSKAPPPDRYIVVLKDSVAKPGRVAERHSDNRGARITNVYRHAIKGYAAKISKGQLKAVRQDPMVKFVSRDHVLRLFSQTTPTGIDRVFATANEALAINGEDDRRIDANVAVIDTGIDHEHPDLDVVGGANCATPEEGSFECHDGLTGDYDVHGTHVAGTVGAIDNGEGVVGVAPGARLWSVQVYLFTPVELFESSAMAGVDWVAATRQDEDPDNDIDVANMSFGCTEGFHFGCNGLPALDGAISSAVEAGVVMVASAGNESTDATKTHPASHPDVITVSALADFDGVPGGLASDECTWLGREADDTLASFSNYGALIDVAAPGVCILSTLPGNQYGALSGTSMASPHVAGAAAILAAQDKPESKADVEAIRDTIVEAGNFDWEDTSPDEIHEPLLDVSDEEVFDGIFPSSTVPTFSFAFGSEGSGNGQFHNPVGIATDAEGNLWVTDLSRRVQKFNDKGEYLTQFGEEGSGNGQFNNPYGIAIDPKGNLWVTDSGNNRVQKFNDKGEYLTQFGEAGSGDGEFAGPFGIATDPKGNLWVTDPGNNRVQKFDDEGEYLAQFGEGGSGEGQFNGPFGIAIDAEGDVWVTDANNHRVQKFNSDGEYLAEFGEEGSGNGQFNNPFGIAIDPEGSLWVTDANNNRVQKFNDKGEYLTQFGEKGSGNGQFNLPLGIASDPEGNLWVTDHANHRVQRWSLPGPTATTDPATEVSTEAATLNATVNPNGLETTYRFEYGTTTKYGSKVPGKPKGIGSGSEAIEVKEALEGLDPGTTYHFRVVAINAEGTTHGKNRQFTTKATVPTFSFAFGSEGSGNGQFHNPAGIATDPEGNLWVTDVGNSRVQKFNDKGEYLTVFGEEGSGDGQFYTPYGVATDPEGNLWVTDSGNNRAQKFNDKGEYLAQFGESGSGDGQFSNPIGIAIAAEGDVWVTDTNNHRVQKFNAEGEYLAQFGEAGSGDGQFNGPFGITIDAEGSLWVTEIGNHRVQKFNAEGEYLTQFGEEGFGNGQFNTPVGIATDAEDSIWVTDLANNRVQMFNAEGEYLTQFGEAGSGDGQFLSPFGIATDAKGNLWVTDPASHRVQRWLVPSPAPPAVGAQHASGVTAEAATLNATVDPNGFETTYQFEYGTTTEYGSKVPADPKGIGSGNEAVEVKEALEGLDPGTTYHFRVVATNAEGTTHGNDREFTTEAVPTFSFAFGFEGSGNGQFNGPVGIATDPEGDLWVTDSWNNRVQKFDAEGEYLTQFGEEGTGNGQLNAPFGIATDAKGDLWVADNGNKRVQKFDDKGEYLAQFGEEGTGDGQFAVPGGIATDIEGNLWVTDVGNNRVQKFDEEGEYLTQFGEEGSGDGQFNFPFGIAIDAEGNLWVTDSGNNRVQKFNDEGEYLAQFGEEGTGDGQLSSPYGIATDAEGDLWVTDSWNNRVQKFNDNGEYLAQFGEAGSGDGQFNGPIGIASDAEGSLWVTDHANHRVQRWVY